MQAVIIMFSRIVDIERFSEVVLSAIREEEKRELVHRLGILNVMSPMSVSGARSVDDIAPKCSHFLIGDASVDGDAGHEAPKFAQCH